MIIRIPNAEAPRSPIWFTTCDSHYRQESRSRPTGFAEDAQLLFVLSGAGVLRCEGREFPLHQGCAFYLEPGVPHCYEDLGDLMTAWITWKGEGQDAIREYIGKKSFLFCEHTDVGFFASRIEKISREYFSGRREGVLSAMLYSLVMHFFDGITESEPSDMDRVIFYMEEHFARKITLEELADVARCSRSTFCKRFKEQFGCTAIETLVEIRLRNAELLLRTNPEYKVYLVAQQCGFEDISYFCRAYRKRFGSSPTSVRTKEK